LVFGGIGRMSRVRIGQLFHITFLIWRVDLDGDPSTSTHRENRYYSTALPCLTRHRQLHRFVLALLLFIRNTKIKIRHHRLTSL
jgi:hypothetical protein